MLSCLNTCKMITSVSRTRLLARYTREMSRHISEECRDPSLCTHLHAVLARVTDISRTTQFAACCNEYLELPPCQREQWSRRVRIAVQTKPRGPERASLDVTTSSELVESGERSQPLRFQTLLIIRLYLFSHRTASLSITSTQSARHHRIINFRSRYGWPGYDDREG